MEVGQSHLMMELFINKSFVDIVCLLGPEKVPVQCNQLILKRSSSYFETLLTDRWQQRPRNPNNTGEDEPSVLEIELPYVDPTTFEAFLKFACDDDVSRRRQHLTEGISHTQLIKLLFFADEYLVSCLKEECEELLYNQITVQSAIEIYEAACLLNLCLLKGKTEDYIVNNFASIILEPSFFTVERRFLLDFLPLDDLQANEIEVINAVFRWAELKCTENDMEKNGKNMREVLGNALFHIRFPTLSYADFEQQIRRPEILLTLEYVDVYSYIRFRSAPWKEFCSRMRMIAGSFLTAEFLEGIDKINNEYLCNGSETCSWFEVDKRIEVCSVGFLGPGDADCCYKVVLEVVTSKTPRTKLQRSVYAKQMQIFYVSFDTPITVAPRQRYYLNFRLKGPKKTACPHFPTYYCETVHVEVGDVHFTGLMHGNPLAAIRFRKLY